MQHPTLKPSGVPRFISFSIVVVYKDEGYNLPALLSSLQSLAYPHDKFQVLLVNDGSTDNSVEICKDFARDSPTIDVVLLDRKRVSVSGKKDGITQAVKEALYDHIVVTDADCIVPTTWLTTFQHSLASNKNAKFIVWVG